MLSYHTELIPLIYDKVSRIVIYLDFVKYQVFDINFFNFKKIKKYFFNNNLLLNIINMVVDESTHSIIKCRKDKMYNQSLHVVQDGVVFLHLPTVKFNKKRFIGKINYEEKTFYSVKRRKKYHLFRQNNSLSLPYDLIHKRKKGFLYICINLDGKKLWSSALAFKQYGNTMTFSKQGFETQVFLELNKFKKNRKEARTERIVLRRDMTK